MPDPVDLDNLYASLGPEPLDRLTAEFYRRVREDDLIGPMYPPDEWEQAQQRLRDFLIQRFGGPTTYSDQRGHPRLRMRHMPFKIDVAARNRWMQLMTEAADNCDFDEPVRQSLLNFFGQVATFMINQPAA
jgi:hemoglobin